MDISLHHRVPLDHTSTQGSASLRCGGLFIYDAFLAAVFAYTRLRVSLHHTSTQGSASLRCGGLFIYDNKVEFQYPQLWKLYRFLFTIQAHKAPFCRHEDTQAHYITSASMFRVLRPPYTSTLLNQLRCFACYGRQTQAPYPSASMFRVLRPPYTRTLLNQLRCFASYGHHTQAPYSISFDVSRPTAATHKHITASTRLSDILQGRYTTDLCHHCIRFCGCNALLLAAHQRYTKASC